MKKRALRKDFHMEIKKSLNRFLSIFFIVAMGVAFFSGIQSSAPDMRVTGDDYFDTTNLMDLRVIGTFGLTEADMTALRALEQVETVDAGYMTDVLSGEGENQAVLHVASILPSVNQMVLTEGRMPQKSGECFLDADYMDKKEIAVGDVIKFHTESQDNGILKTMTYTVVGSGFSSEYLSFNKGSSTLGNGEVAGFVSILLEDFDSTVYTVAYLKVKGSGELQSYSQEYDDLISSVEEEAKGIADGRSEIRYQEVRKEAQDQLDAGRAQIEKGQKDLEQARQDLEDGKETAESELEEARSKLVDGTLQLKDGQQTLIDTKNQLENAKQQLSDGEQLLISKQQELASGKEQLSDASSKLEAARSQLEQGQSEYDAAAETSLKKLEDGQKQIDTAKQELESNQALLQDQSEQLSVSRQTYDEKAAAMSEAQSQYDAGVTALAAAESEYTAQSEQASEQITGLQAQYDAGMQQYNQGSQALETLVAQVAQLQTAYDAAAAQTAAKQQEYDAAAGQSSAYQSELNEKQQIVADQNALVSNLQGQNSQLQTEIQQIENQKVQVQTDIDNLGGQIAVKQAELNGLDTTAEDYQNKADALNGEIAELTSQKNQKEAELGGLDASGKTAAINDNNNAIAAAQSTADTAQARVNELTSLLEAANGETATKQAELGTLQQTQAEAKASLDVLSQTLSEQTAGLDTAKQNLDTLKGAIDSATGALAAGRVELDAQQGKMAETKVQLDQGQQQLAQAGAQLSAGEEKLASAQAQLSAGAAELKQQQKKIDEGRSQLEAARTKLQTGWNELNQNAALLQSSQAQITDGENQLADGWATLEDSRQQLSDGETALADGEEEIEENQSTLADGWKEYRDGQIDADQQIQTGEEQLAQAQKTLEDAQAQIVDSQKEIDDLKHPEWYVSDRSVLPEYSGYGDNADRMTNIGQVFPVLFFLVAALISLTTMTRMVEEERTQIGTLKALGYRKKDIAAKYLKYAFYATLGGSMFGILVGEKILPYIIIYAYGMMYHHLPKILIPYNWSFGLMATAAALVCTIGAALSACAKELSSSPAVLMRPPAPKEGKRVWLEFLPFIWKRLSFTWKSTVRNLLRYKKRFLMTVIGIGGCMALMLVGFGIKDSVRDIVLLQYGQLQTYDEMVILDGDRTAAQEAELDTSLAADTQVAGTLKLYAQKVTATNGKKEFTPYLYVPETMEQLEEFMVFRNRETHEAYPLTDEGALVTEKLADMLGLSKGDEITIHSDDLGDIQVPITDIVENYLYHYIYLTPAGYEKYYGSKPDYNSLLLNVTDETVDGQKLGSKLLSMDAVQMVSYTNSLADQLDDMLGSLDIIIAVLIISAGMLAFVVLYNLNNININERKRELATIKVLGFYDGEVSAYVYRENILLTLIGAAVGALLGIGLHRYVITTVEVDACMFGRNINLMSFVYSALFTFGFSIFVNIVMHFKLKKIDMVESLKSVE